MYSYRYTRVSLFAVWVKNKYLFCCTVQCRAKPCRDVSYSVVLCCVILAARPKSCWEKKKGFTHDQQSGQVNTKELKSQHLTQTSEVACFIFWEYQLYAPYIYFLWTQFISYHFRCHPRHSTGKRHLGGFLVPSSTGPKVWDLHDVILANKYTEKQRILTLTPSTLNWCNGLVLLWIWICPLSAPGALTWKWKDDLLTI